ncbi:isoprenylcysteine carboxylmethyltransferase family protein [bacterium]|nr:isoprenylcysteine carboxylmethyltransferase family protein [bacterium]
MKTFALDRKYIIAYWVTLATYIVAFTIMILTIGYSYNQSFENPWIRRIGLLIFLFGWLVWYLGRKKLGPDSVDIDPLGSISRKMLYPSHKNIHIKPPKVINNGIYSITRHPQYWGTVLFYIGLSIALASIPALVFSVLFVLPAHIWRAAVEEKMLMDLFGEKYIDYKEKVKH